MTQKHQKCQKFEKYQKWGGCNNLPVTKHEWTPLNRPESVLVTPILGSLILPHSESLFMTLWVLANLSSVSASETYLLRV